MDSRKTTVAALMASMIGLGCQHGAEVDFVRPRLSSIEPASISGPGKGHLQLRLGLWAEPGQSLTPDDRVLAGSTTIWLNTLEKEDFVVSSLRLAGRETRAKLVELQHQSASVSPLTILVDNSEAAAMWDPQEHRLAAVRTFVDSLKTMVDGGLLDEPEVSLLLLQQGQVHASVEGGRVAEVLQALSDDPLLQSPGGRAPLWDALLASRGRVVLYWGSSGDGDSAAAFYQVLASFSDRSAGSLIAVAGPEARTTDLVQLAAVCQGALLEAAAPQAIGTQLRIASAMVAGWWSLTLDPEVKHPVSGGARAAGAVELQLAGRRWSQSFQLPLLGR